MSVPHLREAVPHVCDCDDCSPEPFVDRCQYEADRDRYKAALELIASGTVGPSIMRMTACEVLGLEPPAWTCSAGPDRTEPNIGPADA